MVIAFKKLNKTYTLSNFELNKSEVAFFDNSNSKVFEMF